MSAALLTALLTLAACDSPPRQRAADLPPVHPKPLSHLEPPPTADLPTAQATVYLQQIVVPLDLPADLLWQRVDEAAFPAVTRSVWNANGLRIGVIERADLPAALNQLPPTIANQQRKLIASTHPTAVRVSPPLTTPFTVDLTIPPLAVNEDRIIAGRAQLLLSVDPNHTLYLTPHHYKREPAIAEHIEQLRRERLGEPAPRQSSTILDKELDGRVFRELTLGLAPSRRDVLVVGLYRPWPLIPVEDLPPTPDVPAANASPAESANPFERFDLTHPPVLRDDTLGRALFTGVAAGRPVQLVLLITLQPLNPTDTGRAALR